MTQEGPWFFRERAEAFVKLVLTRHGDVNVLPCADRSLDVDLLVEALKEGKPTLRFFGARLVPYLDLPDRHTLDGGAVSDGAAEASLPICVFVIGVRKPEGLYR